MNTRITRLARARLLILVSSMLCATAPGLLVTTEAMAQSYPSRPPRLLVPFAAGGTVDTVGRVMAAKMGELLGQPVLIENRPGAGGNLAADLVAKAAPDGYTLLLTTIGHTISPALYKKLPYDVQRDFASVSQVVSSTMALVASPRLGANNVAEMIALARAKPGSLNYGTTGVGNPLQLSMELLRLTADIQLMAVPYKGDAPLNTALMAGEVDLAFVPYSGALPHIRSGKLKGLAVTSLKRTSTAPDLPTVAETLPGYEAVSWQAIFAPAKTPREVIQKLADVAARAAQAPEIRSRLEGMGQEVVGGTPEQLDARVKGDLAVYTRIVREAKIPLQD